MDISYVLYFCIDAHDQCSWLCLSVNLETRNEQQRNVTVRGSTAVA
jgi:hypothetical protein